MNAPIFSRKKTNKRKEDAEQLDPDHTNLNERDVVFEDGQDDVMVPEIAPGIGEITARHTG